MVEIILFAPLFGSLFATLFAFSKKNILSALVPILALGVALVCAFIALFEVMQNGAISAILSEWIVAGRFNIDFGFVIDGVSCVMILVVLIVSLFVHIYSVGYMANDECFNKFFAFLSAFVFSMLILVMSDNFLGLFIGWEGVGLCSWMLIGFWHNRKSASFAANEAFIMNRIADLGLLLGIFLIFYVCGSLKYSVVFGSVGDIDGVILMWIGILLFIGAMGKSAQFPLHTWLADAMEGPTPVSALIHAATMVTAGVYLVIRANPIYDAIPHIGLMIAYLGAFVAIFAASMALVNNDLKRIIAYSTLSQLGYMFVAGGLGYYAIALFHLTTHAFFKSLLFLGAGNVMHAMNDKLDISKMGALWKPLRFSAILMIIASVALAGIYPFAGFFSKDKILESAFVEGNFGIYIVLLLSAFLTAFYSFRLIMLVFFAPKNYENAESSANSHESNAQNKAPQDSHESNAIHDSPHEASKIMLYAMTPLAILAVLAGFFEHSFMDFIAKFITPKEAHLDSATFAILIALALFVAIAGIIFAIFIYRPQSKWWQIDKAKIQENFIYKLLKNQYYIPRIYDIVFIRSYKAIAKFLWREIDLKIIDFMVDLIAKIFLQSAQSARKLQSGILTQSLMLMSAGIFVMLAILAIAGI
ncbi:NADH-quinone oxidoreductase subunit L [Helicobacter sp. 23-1045]